MLLLGTYDSDARAREALTAFKKAGVRSARQGIHSEMPAQYRVRLSGTKEALAGFNKPAAAGEVVKCDPPLPEPPSVPVAGKNAATGLTE